jgi:hypothetical protein
LEDDRDERHPENTVCDAWDHHKREVSDSENEHQYGRDRDCGWSDDGGDAETARDM